ncbi:MAG: glutathione S-transferase family protein, partial [Pseudomonadota bacterium]
MKRLYHWSLDPVARTARLALAEKRLAFEEVETRPWAVHPDMERLGPGAAPPAFVDTTGEGRITLLGTHALLEYLDDAYPNPRLIPAGHQDAAEARRLWRWCED